MLNSFEASRLSLRLMILAAAAAFALAACGGGGGGGGSGSGPEKAARQWLDALNANNLTAAQEMSTDATKGMIIMAQSMGEDMAVGKYKITNVSTTSDNAAQVTVKVEGSGEEVMLDLVRIDGKWKVGIRK